MSSLLLRNIRVLATMEGADILDAAVQVEDGWITWVGSSADAPQTADVTVDLTDHVVLPGLINTHHHLYQTLTRVVPGAQDSGLFQWLLTLYPVWARLTPDHVRVATALGLAELALSGCTTAFDHQYLWPNGSSVDDQVEGAGEIGIRFHVSRGSMSLGESQGGLPPDSVVEDAGTILEDTRRAVETHHDPEPGSMLRVVVAPCSPFSVTPDLMRESARLARDLGVGLHTHLAETDDEERFCIDNFELRPVAYMESLDWMGEDVWYAHAVHVGDDEIARMAAFGTGVAHCPTSNMRLASGFAPVAGYVAHGVRVGLGVDGSASNDGSHMMNEVRQALLLNRMSVSPGVGAGPQMTARQALRLGTTGGAAVLGRPEIGRVAVGAAADMIAFDLNRIEFAGALHDPVAATVMCGPVTVDHSWVHGRRVVEDGQLVGVDLRRVVEEHNRLSLELVG